MSDDSGPSPTPGYSRVVDTSTRSGPRDRRFLRGVETLFLAMMQTRSAVPDQVLAHGMDLDQVKPACSRCWRHRSITAHRGPTRCGSRSASCPNWWACCRAVFHHGGGSGFNVAGDRALIVVHKPQGDTAAVVTAARALIERGGSRMGMSNVTELRVALTVEDFDQGSGVPTEMHWGWSRSLTGVRQLGGSWSSRRGGRRWSYSTTPRPSRVDAIEAGHRVLQPQIQFAAG